MKPAGVCVKELVALCPGWNLNVMGRRRARRAASVLQENTSVTLGNVWQLSCAPACTTDSSTSLMTSTRITTASGQWLWSSGASKTIFICAWSLIFFLPVNLATVRRVPCTAAHLKRALHCLTSSTMMTSHCPEVQCEQLFSLTFSCSDRWFCVCSAKVSAVCARAYPFELWHWRKRYWMCQNVSESGSALCHYCLHPWLPMPSWHSRWSVVSVHVCWKKRAAAASKKSTCCLIHFRFVTAKTASRLNSVHVSITTGHMHQDRLYQ